MFIKNFVTVEINFWNYNLRRDILLWGLDVQKAYMYLYVKKKRKRKIIAILIRWAFLMYLFFRSIFFPSIKISLKYVYKFTTYKSAPSNQEISSWLNEISQNLFRKCNHTRSKSFQISLVKNQQTFRKY